jgi:transposase
MPKGEMFTAAYYIRNILTEIVARRGERGERSLVMHADNARPHTAKVTRALCDDKFLRIAPHPPYSPDLASSDFLLFLV